MDNLTRNILTEIQGGKHAWEPTDRNPDSLLAFQAIVKRIEWAKRQGYIKDTRSLPCMYDSRPGLMLSVVVLGGLTLEGEQYLLGDEDDAAF